MRLINRVKVCDGPMLAFGSLELRSKQLECMDSQFKEQETIRCSHSGDEKLEWVLSFGR